MSQAFIIQNNVEWLSWLHIHRLLMFLFTDWFAVVSSLSQIRSRIFSKAKLSSTVTVRKCHGKLWHFRRKTWHYWHVFSCDIFFNQRDEQKKIILNWLLILCKWNNLCYLSCRKGNELRPLKNFFWLKFGFAYSLQSRSLYGFRLLDSDFNWSIKAVFSMCTVFVFT